MNEHMTATVLMLGLAASEGRLSGRRPIQSGTRTVRELNCRLRHSNAVRVELRQDLICSSPRGVVCSVRSFFAVMRGPGI
jgi:hypothetical protein